MILILVTLNKNFKIEIISINLLLLINYIGEYEFYTRYNYDTLKDFIFYFSNHNNYFNTFLFNTFLFNTFLFNTFLFNTFLFNIFLFNIFLFNIFLFNIFLILYFSYFIVLLIISLSNFIVL